MKKYRLKKEAVQFVLEKHATSIYSLDTWESLGICEKALEEVSEPYLSYGISRTENSSTLGGWNKDEVKSFEFTIHFPSVAFNEHDRFSKGRLTRELMDKIQRAISNHYEQFVTNESN